MDSPRILIIPGSARDGSLNRQLAAVAAATARAAGLQVTEMDLRALALVRGPNLMLRLSPATSSLRPADLRKLTSAASVIRSVSS